jgi:uncharacterized protein HemX
LILLVVGLAGTLFGLNQAQKSAAEERRAKLDAEDKRQLAEQQQALAEQERFRAKVTGTRRSGDTTFLLVLWFG